MRVVIQEVLQEAGTLSKKTRIIFIVTCHSLSCEASGKLSGCQESDISILNALKTCVAVIDSQVLVLIARWTSSKMLN